jgi:hypothetical protein
MAVRLSALRTGRTLLPRNIIILMFLVLIYVIIIIIIICVSLFYFMSMFFHSLKYYCGLVVRVPGYRMSGPEFDSLRYQIFWEVVGLERGPLSLVSTTEELLGRESSG